MTNGKAQRERERERERERATGATLSNDHTQGQFLKAFICL